MKNESKTTKSIFGLPRNLYKFKFPTKLYISELTKRKKLKNSVSMYYPPKLTAQCWCIVDGITGKQLWGKQSNERREIASLTKITTALTVSRLIKKGVASWEETVICPNFAEFTPGTSADILGGD